ncbi:MAG: sulfotransferase [Gammaproteobacteria bacterium]|nr:sulfotransferase [Gammaproteobacteria bacterium]
MRDTANIISHSPIIIGGFYRSGTTLLRRILNAHSRIHCGPEVKFFPDLFGDYLDDDLAHVRFFSTVRSLGVTDQELVEIYGKAYIETHERVARRANKQRWADKAPENVLYCAHWQRLLNGGFYFVHVVRHPLDALASLVEAGFARTIPKAFEKKVELYKTFLKAGLSIEESHAENCIRLYYEQLVSEPVKVLRELLSRVNESFEPSILDAYNDTAQTGIEDPKIRRASEIHQHSVGRWRRDLSSDQVKIAQNVLGELMHKIGYDTEQ